MVYNEDEESLGPIPGGQDARNDNRKQHDFWLDGPDEDGPKAAPKDDPPVNEPSWVGSLMKGQQANGPSDKGRDKDVSLNKASPWQFTTASE
ncbi:hypothetical protein TWF970_008450 [Orbilia oligospora]|uniref:Uncharacterized protein n=1 Tax=Orbilia oligospora TaxID=2813651 RepID=A0A7C8VNM2_ORBOL|nr:hypothetical protein TWF970_008450 [Orbilia oligospora]